MEAIGEGEWFNKRYEGLWQVPENFNMRWSVRNWDKVKSG